jgi:hypothetical protein
LGGSEEPLDDFFPKRNDISVSNKYKNNYISLSPLSSSLLSSFSYFSSLLFLLSPLPPLSSSPSLFFLIFPPLFLIF